MMFVTADFRDNYKCFLETYCFTRGLKALSLFRRNVKKPDWLGFVEIRRMPFLINKTP